MTRVLIAEDSPTQAQELELVLAAEGYDGLFSPKPKSPCLHYGRDKLSDGNGLFWRK